MAVFLDVGYTKVKSLLGSNFQEINPTAEYEQARFISDNPKLTIILYKSGKLQIQGKKDFIEPVEDILIQAGFKPKDAPLKPKTAVQPKNISEDCRIGSDETLKGDTFGGMVVVGVRADSQLRQKLIELKVRDSKNIEDATIRLMAPQIKAALGESNYAIQNVYPKEYNKHKQTQLLNDLHKVVAKQIQNHYKEKNCVHIVDKYPGCTVGDIIETKAESKYIEVAAASIIARDEALNQLQDLSKELGYVVPKGSTHVSQALEYLRQSKKDPNLFVKLHFSNVQEALK